MKNRLAISKGLLFSLADRSKEGGGGAVEQRSESVCKTWQDPSSAGAAIRRKTESFSPRKATFVRVTILSEKNATTSCSCGHDRPYIS